MSRPSLSTVAALALLAGVGSSPPARAESTTLRIATIAPDGSAWARELRAWARDVAVQTEGAVTVKVYFAGIGGDEFTVLDRIRRDQLDGIIGSESCARLAPSLRVSRVIGLFQDRDESAYVLTRLKPELDRELMQSSFINLGEAGLGPEVLFTRQPVRSLAELRAARLWVWDLDQQLRAQAEALGLHVVPLPIEQAAHAYEAHQVDGFIGVPVAALAFQWSTDARYFSDLRLSFRSGCLMVASRFFDALPLASQRSLRASAAKLRARIEDLGRQQDSALLGGLFARQGLQLVPVSASFRSEFFEAAQRARAAGHEAGPRRAAATGAHLAGRLSQRASRQQLTRGRRGSDGRRRSRREPAISHSTSPLRPVAI